MKVNGYRLLLLLLVVATSGCQCSTSSLVSIPTITQQFRVEREHANIIEALIEAGGFASEINGGSYVVNDYDPSGLSILVSAPSREEHFRLAQLNAFYDRPTDLIVLDASVLPSLEVAERSVVPTNLTVEELGQVRFCQFLLLHEVGHREVGDVDTNRFYFGDRFFSVEQSEELAADSWALRTLLASAKPNIDLLALTRSIADGALLSWFGARYPVWGVPDEHPSMVYRVANLYRALRSTVPENNAPSEDYLVKSLATGIESKLERVFTLPDGETIDSVTSTQSHVYFLTQEGGLAEVGFEELTHSFDWDDYVSSTVRRYTKSRLETRSVVSPRRPGEIRALVGAKDRCLLVRLLQGRMEVLDLLHEQPVLVASGEHVAGVVRFTSGSISKKQLSIATVGSAVTNLHTFDLESHTLSTARVELEKLATRADKHVVAVRSDEVLVQCQPGPAELWSLRQGQGPKLLLSTSPGALWPVCMELFGLAALGPPSCNEVLDATPNDPVTKQQRMFSIGSLTKIHQATKLLGPSRPPLSDWTPTDLDFYPEGRLAGCVVTAPARYIRSFVDSKFVLVFSIAPGPSQNASLVEAKKLDRVLEKESSNRVQ